MLTIEIDGNDGTGKSSVIEILKKRYPNVDFKDRGILTKLTDVFQDELPDALPGSSEAKNTVYFVLDAELETLVERINQRCGSPGHYESYPALFKYRNRFRRLAIKYGTYFIDTTRLSLNDVSEIVSNIIDHKIDEYSEKKLAEKECLNDIKANSLIHKFILPNPDDYDHARFKALPLMVEGLSREVRAIDEHYSLILYKPTIYSHKQQREGVIPNSHLERMNVTRYLLDVLDMEGIPHCYLMVGKQFILCERLSANDIPPIEVIVKRCCVGTDKHRYFDLDKKKSRYGTPVVSEYNRAYPNLIVRFDYRNPNHHPITHQPMGDEVMCDDLADLFIDVAKAKSLANKTFTILGKHFEKMGIYLEDICLMITTDGSKIYSEISQDCGRYKKINENAIEALDKDIWRAGGSSELVLQKWQRLTNLVKDYVSEL